MGCWERWLFWSAICVLFSMKSLSTKKSILLLHLLLLLVFVTIGWCLNWLFGFTTKINVRFWNTIMIVLSNVWNVNNFLYINVVFDLWYMNLFYNSFWWNQYLILKHFISFSVNNPILDPLHCIVYKTIVLLGIISHFTLIASGFGLLFMLTTRVKLLLLSFQQLKCSQTWSTKLCKRGKKNVKLAYY